MEDSGSAAASTIKAECEGSHDPSKDSGIEQAGSDDVGPTKDTSLPALAKSASAGGLGDGKDDGDADVSQVSTDEDSEEALESSSDLQLDDSSPNDLSSESGFAGNPFSDVDPNTAAMSELNENVTNRVRHASMMMMRQALHDDENPWRLMADMVSGSVKPTRASQHGFRNSAPRGSGGDESAETAAVAAAQYDRTMRQLANVERQRSALGHLAPEGSSSGSRPSQLVGMRSPAFSGMSSRMASARPSMSGLRGNHTGGMSSSKSSCRRSHADRRKEAKNKQVLPVSPPCMMPSTGQAIGCCVHGPSPATLSAVSQSAGLLPCCPQLGSMSSRLNPSLSGLPPPQLLGMRNPGLGQVSPLAYAQFAPHSASPKMPSRGARGFDPTSYMASQVAQPFMDQQHGQGDMSSPMMLSPAAVVPGNQFCPWDAAQQAFGLGLLRGAPAPVLPGGQVPMPAMSAHPPGRFPTTVALQQPAMFTYRGEVFYSLVPPPLYAPLVAPPQAPLAELPAEVVGLHQVAAAAQEKMQSLQHSMAQLQLSKRSINCGNLS